MGQCTSALVFLTCMYLYGRVLYTHTDTHMHVLLLSVCLVSLFVDLFRFFCGSCAAVTATVYFKQHVYLCIPNKSSSSSRMDMNPFYLWGDGLRADGWSIWWLIPSWPSLKILSIWLFQYNVIHTILVCVST